MRNPYIAKTRLIKDKVIKQLPCGTDTTADMMLEFMSKSDDKQVKNMATFIKVSKKLPEIKMVFNFVISLLEEDVIPIRGDIYDTGIDGVKELHEYMIDKYGKVEKVKENARVFNIINWLIFRLPAKKEMEAYGLIY